ATCASSTRPAARAAIRSAAGKVHGAETVSSEVSLPDMTGLWGDLRVSVRSLRKQPGFSIAAGLGLALGTGAATDLFSVIHAVLLAPLPFPQPDRLANLWENQPGLDRCSLSAPDFRDFESQAQSLEAIGAYIQGRFALATPQGSQRISGVRTSPGFFQ